VIATSESRFKSAKFLSKLSTSRMISKSKPTTEEIDKRQQVHLADDSASVCCGTTATSRFGRRSWKFDASRALPVEILK